MKTQAKTKKKWTNLSLNFPNFKETSFSLPLLKLLFNRGVISEADLKLGDIKEKANLFLNPKYENLSNPFLLKDMDKAVTRIIKAMEEKEKIAVYGDYDVDGVTSSALLSDIFNKLNIDFEVYIPSRHDEGYGLNDAALKELKEKGVTLVITVDCGVRSIKEVDYAKEIGLDVVVTDHHEIEKREIREKGKVISRDTLPNAVAVINPKRQDSEYPFKELAGVGVAFMLAEALFSELDKKGVLTKLELRRDYTKWLLDLVAFGTICDIATLKEDNRTLVKYGLLVASKSKRIGLKALALSAGVEPEKITSHNFGFHLGPRLNAAGRLEHADISLNLLTAENDADAEIIAQDLSLLNTKRQELTKRIIEEARLALKGKEKDKIILLKNKNWPAGVAGIVASRLVDEWGKPALILEEGELESNGSARSINNFDIVYALKSCEEYLVRYGGHKKAAGLAVKNEHFILLNEKLLKIAENSITEEDLVLEILYDCKLELKEIDFNFYNDLLKLEPFGYGNQTPTFVSENLLVTDSKKIGKEFKHLKLRLRDSEKEIEAIFFNFEDEIKVGDKVDVLYNLIENNWLGRKKIELRLIDLLKNETV